MDHGSDDEEPVDRDTIERDEVKLERLLNNTHLEGEDVVGIPKDWFRKLIFRNSSSIYNEHNLTVLFLTFPGDEHRRIFLHFLCLPELPLVRLIVENCDSNLYARHMKKILTVSIRYKRTDVAEYLFEALEPHFTAKYLNKLLSESLLRSEVLFRLVLAYIEKFSLKSGVAVPEIINAKRVFHRLIEAHVSRFDTLYLLGFNVFILYGSRSFVEKVIKRKDDVLFLRLFDLGLVVDSDLCITLPKDGRRDHYRFLLRVNHTLNTRKPVEGRDEKKDILLRRYIPLQAVPLTATRALVREYYINNRDHTNEWYAYHTDTYLNSLRPERNDDLAVQLRSRRREIRKRRSPILPPS